MEPWGSRIGANTYGVTESPTDRPNAHTRPYLRAANVQAGMLDLVVIRMIDVPPAQVAKHELQVGDLLLVEGDSEELVGRPAIWRGEIPGCVRQNHVIRVRANRDCIESDFLLAYMNTASARLYFLSRSKRTTNLASINSTDVHEMPVPVPRMSKQLETVEEVAKFKQRADDVRFSAAHAERDAFQKAAETISRESAQPSA